LADPPAEAPTAGDRTPAGGPIKIYMSNPTLPTRWSRPVPVEVLERMARIVTGQPLTATAGAQAEIRPLAAPGGDVVLVAGTLDTKGEELRYMRDLIREAGVPVRLVDLSTTGGQAGADIPAHQVAAFHPRGAAGVFTGDRGAAVAAMAEAFTRWIERQAGIAGILSAGGSGGTALVAPAMRALPVGVPKLIVSTVASGDVRQYVGTVDITLMHSVADVQGLNAITEDVLGNAAQAMIGMVQARRSARPRRARRPALALSMFGVTTQCVQQIAGALREEWDCLVFHATGIGGQSMERSSTTARSWASSTSRPPRSRTCSSAGSCPPRPTGSAPVIRTRIPYIGSVGAVDMVNFGAPETVPERYRARLLRMHNPQVTLMRTTASGMRRDRALDRRAAQPDGGAGALLPARGGRLLPRCAGPALPRPGRAPGAVPRHRDDAAARAEPAADPPAAPHQRSGLRRRRSWPNSAGCTAGPGPAARRRRCREHASRNAPGHRRPLPAMIARGEPIIGGGAGTGLSAKCEERAGST
jgi:uncharacterized protein (UPF0261 family)